MARDTAAWFDERRMLAVIGASATAAVGVMTLFDLEEVEARDVLALAAVAGSYLAHGWVRRCPAWVPFAVACISVFVLNPGDMRTEGAMFFVVLALAYLALTEPRRRIVLVCGLGAVAAPAIFGALDGNDVSWHYWVIGFGVGWGTGELGYRFRRARDELARTRALIADQAALDERHRIARDVHDVLGHSLTIVMLQLTAARHLLRRDPEVADAALADAERVGRDSLDQVRRTVHMLRAGETASERDGGQPSPTLDDLEDLLDRCRSAGLSVRAEVVGPIAVLDTSRSIAGYRIVQEAMTNVSKHSPTAETRVTVHVDAPGGVCRIVVASRGGGPQARGSSGQFGLVGMRERARSVGGTVDAGQVEDGWTVSAELPAVNDTGVGA